MSFELQPKKFFLVGTLLLSLVLFFIFYNNESKKQKKEMPLSYDKEDILVVKTKNGRFTLYKIKEVKGDTIYMLVNIYETDQLKGLADIKKKGNTAYAIIPYPIARKTFKEMYENGEIIKKVK